MKQKIRFDCLLHMQYPEFSRRTIQQFIVQGHAFINGAVLCKPGQGVCAGSQVFLDAEKPKFVSRAGFKLEAALHAWSIVVEGMVCMDAGISTGGFTDCLFSTSNNVVTSGLVFSLSPRGTSGERIEGRGILNKNAPPLPGPLLHPMDERERTFCERRF